MQPGKNLTDTTCGVLRGLRAVFTASSGSCSYGDTTTTMAAALAAASPTISPWAMSKAGLRTGNLHHEPPFPRR